MVDAALVDFGQSEPLLPTTLGVEALRLLTFASFIHSFIRSCNFHDLFQFQMHQYSKTHCTIIFIIRWNPRVSHVHLAWQSREFSQCSPYLPCIRQHFLPSSIILSTEDKSEVQRGFSFSRVNPDLLKVLSMVEVAHQDAHSGPPFTHPHCLPNSLCPIRAPIKLSPDVRASQSGHCFLQIYRTIFHTRIFGFFKSPSRLSFRFAKYFWISVGKLLFPTPHV